MKIRGGYSPNIAGRPSNIVEEPACSSELRLNLQRGEVRYRAVVSDGQMVKLGDVLAREDSATGRLCLASPVAGKVAVRQTGNGGPDYLTLTGVKKDTAVAPYGKFEPSRATAEDIRSALVECGAWQYFWSSRTGGAPSLDETEIPKTIIITSVSAEPFRTRGKIILLRSWKRVLDAIRFLPRLLADYGKVNIIFTARNDPLAKTMYNDLVGDAWVQFHTVPVSYPIAIPRLLVRRMRDTDPSFTREDTIWTIDVQGLEAVGDRLAEGMPVRNRIVAIGGPGEPNPRHMCVKVGTPIRELISSKVNKDKVLVLRGGIMTGEPVDLNNDSVNFDDDGFFCLPISEGREFLGFLRPGFNRSSYFSSFASGLLGRPDGDLTDSLRGEPRPCIACGACENVCPVDLLPQILHRYWYRNALDEIEAAGLERCVDCGLCTFVCPSKIELQHQFAETKKVLAKERAEVARHEEEARKAAEAAKKAAAEAGEAEKAKEATMEKSE